MPATPPPSNPTPRTDPVVVRWLEALTAALRDHANPGGPVQRFSRWLGRALVAANVGYVLVLVMVLAVLEWRAEKHWFTSMLLFLPAHGWLLPLAVLTPLTLLFRPRWLALHAACAGLVLLGYMDPQFGGAVPPRGKAFKVLTNNRGQDQKQSLSPFIQAEDPDIILFQEAGREAQFKRAYPKLHVRAVGEFTVVSRHPVLTAELLPERSLRNRPVAARFELDVAGERIVLYNIHLTSPRNPLQPMAYGGFIPAWLNLDGGYGAELRADTIEFWNHQMAMAASLAARARQETLPLVLAGDFNVPNHGVIYHTFRGAFTDAFEERGRGYGFTFPGYSRNPFTGFGAWLRLDQVFANARLRPVYCRAEPSRRSQHRAMVAAFEVVPAP